MIHSVRFIAVLDTNIIYPIIIRDVLFWFAHYDLYTPKWSNHIFKEWERLMIRKGVEKNEIAQRIQKANLAFPDALVINYERFAREEQYALSSRKTLITGYYGLICASDF